MLHGGFHGRTYGALSATPQESKQAPFAPLVPGFVPVAPDPAALDAAVHDGTAAVLLEPIQGETGVNLMSAELLQAARAACDRTGAALVFDEVQTGMGRTGTLWAYEGAGVVPDAITRQGARRRAPDRRADHRRAARRRARAGRPRLDVRRRSGDRRRRARRARRARDPALLARVRELGDRLQESLRELPGVAPCAAAG